MPSSITVQTNGQSLSVNASISHWTTEALANTASTSNDVESSTWTTITSDYTMYFANTAQFVTVTVKQVDGTTIHTGTYKAGPGAGARSVAPLPSGAQVAADVDRLSSLALAPSGAVAETCSRASVQLSNQAALTSGRLFLAAVSLSIGTRVTSATWLSGTTAAGTPTNQWFALYDRSLGLLGQTADDTSTAWAANSTKTLTFSSPITTTYSGLHYLGIMVAASTVPTLMAFQPSTVVTLISPAVSGLSTTGLTTTAPSTAAALSAVAVFPYAYVS